MKAMAWCAAVPLLAWGGVHACPAIGAQDGDGSVQDGDFETRRNEARELLAERLQSYADWCRGKRLFLERKVICERLLELDPENGDALRFLGWTKGASGEWMPPKRPKTFRNFDEDALAEAPARYAKEIAPYLERLRAMLAEKGLSPDQRRTLEEDLLIAAPDDPELRAKRREERVGDRWVLEETARALEGRKRLEELVSKTLADAPEPTPEELTEREAAFGLPWDGALSMPGFRVLGTVGAEERERAARTVFAAIAVFHELLGAKATLPPGTTLVLLSGPEEGAAFLQAHPDLTPEAREGLAKLAGTWVEGANDVAYWAEMEEQRLDGLVRIVLAYLLGAEYGLTLQHAWAHEGLGLVLTEALVGTRLTWFVRPLDPWEDEEGTNSLRTELIESSDWMVQARALVQRPERPSLSELVVKGPLDLTPSDLLLSYAFARYLLEARPADVPRIVRSLGLGKKPVAALEEVLGSPLSEIDRRLGRWVLELTDEEAPLRSVAPTASKEDG